MQERDCRRWQDGQFLRVLSYAAEPKVDGSMSLWVLFPGAMRGPAPCSLRTIVTQVRASLSLRFMRREMK